MDIVDIAEWLDGLGLGRYAPAFVENEVGWEILPRLTSDDLREMGIVAVGHRRQLLEAIAASFRSGASWCVERDFFGSFRESAICRGRFWAAGLACKKYLPPR